MLYEKAQPALQDFSLEEFSEIDEYVNNQRFQLVLVAIDDPVESKKIYYQCKLHGLNVNIADVPKLCDFYFGSVLRKGSLQLMISTNGKSPRIARLVKDKISEKFQTDEELQNIDTVVERIGLLRGLLRQKLPNNDLDSIDKRMKWMIKVTDMFTFSQWSHINVEKIIDYFPEFPPSDPALLQ